MKFTLKKIGRGAGLLLLLATFAFAVAAQQPGSGILRGQISDEFGGRIVGATVTVTDAAGKSKTVVTDDDGAFAVAGLAPGRYSVRAFAAGFAPFENPEVEVSPGRNELPQITLGVSLEKEEVTVAAEGAVNIDNTNPGSIVLKGKELEALPEDPDELSAALQALAGPSAGPNGGQITIDGFEGGRIPPKDSIREVRINDNPLSAERDQPGFGGIQIFTKPGTDKLRVSAFTSFSDESLNSRNPFATERAPYQLRRFGGNISGTIIPKKASFFFDIERNATDDNDIINATLVDPATFAESRFVQSVLTPNRRLNVSPRFDLQLSKDHTLTTRYNFFRQQFDLLGLSSGFALLSRAYDQTTTQHTLQMTETAVLNAKTINETRFQFLRSRSEQNGDNTAPAVIVSEAFFGGGPQVGNSFNDTTRVEVTNITTLAQGAQTIKFGGRLRRVSLTDFSQNNFGGTYSFFGGAGGITSIERYRRTLALPGTTNPETGAAYTSAELFALGALPTQLTVTGGNPEADVSQVDFGGFIQDDWKVRPNLTLGAGLRYETQSNISSNLNFAPRAYIAWSPDGGPNRQAKTVIRFGAGIFYDRFNENYTLQANRLNGINQQQFLVTDPGILAGLAAQVGPDGTFPTPSVSALTGSGLPQTTRRVAPDVRTPYSYTTGLFIERQMSKTTTLNLGYITYRTRHALRSRDLNVAAPGTFDPRVPRAHVYQYESSGTQNMQQLQLGVNQRFSPALSVSAFYSLGKVQGDTDGPNSFPSDYTNLRADYGRASFDVRHRLFLFANITVPRLKLTLNPVIIANSSRPFNVITGVDTNGDGVLTERPSLVSNATCAARTQTGAGIFCTPYGTFNINPALGEATIPRNFAEGPGFFTVNLNVSRQWGFGTTPEARARAAAQAGTQAGGEGSAGRGGGRRGGSSSRGGSSGGGSAGSSGGPRMGGPGMVMMGGPGGGGSEHRYTMTFSVNVQNLFNRVNLATPVSNLSSPFFGQSLQSFGGGFMFIGGPGGGPGGGSSAAGNRRVQATLRFNF